VTSATALTTYIAVLMVGGLAMLVFGVALPLGGGLVVALIGAAGLAAGFTLIGVRMMGKVTA